MTIRTLSELFEAVVRHDKPDCLLHKSGGRFVPISTREFAARVRRLARALEKAGIRPGDRIVQMSENGPHWHTIDFGALALGAAHVPIYPTLLPEGAAYIARDCGARILFVQGEERLAGMLGVREQMPTVERIVAIDARAAGPGVTDLESFLATGDDVSESQFSRVAAPGTARRPGDSHLHQRHHRRPQGRHAHPRQPGLQRARRQRGAQARPVVDRPVLPAARALVRAHGGLPLLLPRLSRSPTRNRSRPWPRTSSRCGRTCSSSVPRVYEKVMARVYENARGGSAVKRAIFELGGQGRPAPPAGPARGPAREPGAQASPTSWSSPRSARRLGGRFGFAVSGGAPLAARRRRVLLGRRRAHLRGLRPDRDHRRAHRQSPRPHQARHGRPGRAAASRSRIADDGEILAAAAPTHARLLRQARGDAPRSSTPRAGSTPATSACSTDGYRCASPTARRSSSSTPTARTSPRRRSRTCSSPAAGSPRRWSSATGATSSPR